jgi:hypothetical protein
VLQLVLSEEFRVPIAVVLKDSMPSISTSSIWFLRQAEIETCAQELPTGDNLAWADKYGKPMICIGQINFAARNGELGQDLNSGLLRLFLSESHKSHPIKDPACFKVEWTPSNPPSLNAVSLLRGKQARLCQGKEVEKENLTQESYLFFQEHPHLEEAKLIAAFAANGITYSAQRGQDSCYHHLAAAAETWRLLWRIPCHDVDLLLMIEETNLLQRALEKCFLVRFWA